MNDKFVPSTKLCQVSEPWEGWVEQQDFNSKLNEW